MSASTANGMGVDFREARFGDCRPRRSALRGWGIALSVLAHAAVLGSVAIFLASRAVPTEPPPETAIVLVFAPPPPEPSPTAVQAASVPDFAPPAAEASTPKPPPVAEEQVEQAFLPVAPVPVSRPRAIPAPHRVPVPAATQPLANTESATAAPAPMMPARPVAGMESDRPPSYPEAARRRGEQGRVVLRVDVSADGLPLDVSVAEGSGFPSLDAAAIGAVRQWRFVPATRGGTPVAAAAQVPIRFRLTN